MSPETSALVYLAIHHLNPVLHPGWHQVQVVYSQAGPRAESRVITRYPNGYVGRSVLPAAAQEALRQLRAVRAAEGALFFSVMILQQPGAGPQVFFNDSQRPYWNSPTDDLLTPSPGVALPDMAQWEEDLAQFPNIPAPTWFVPEVPGVEMQHLATMLAEAGVPSGWVELDGGGAVADLGDYHQGPWCEGRIVLRRVGPGYYSLSVRDYGHDVEVAVFTEERPACAGLWHYLHEALPAPMAMARTEVADRVEAAAATFGQLRDRVENMGRGGLVTTMPAGLLLDHIGSPDGVYLYPWGTEQPQRSLPETAYQAAGSQQRTFLTAVPIEVQAEVVAPWFDQPGGGLRFRLLAGTLRDAVRGGMLRSVEITG